MVRFELINDMKPDLETVKNSLTGKTEDDRRAERGWLSVTAVGLCGLEGSLRRRQGTV